LPEEFDKSEEIGLVVLVLRLVLIVVFCRPFLKEWHFAGCDRGDNDMFTPYQIPSAMLKEYEVEDILKAIQTNNFSV